MLRQISYVLFSVLTLMITVNASAKNVIFVTEDLAPFQISSPNKPPSGAAIELVETIIQEANLKAEIQFYPWARAFNTALKQKNTFIFSMLRSKEREQKFHWIGKVHSIQAYLAAPKSNISENINTLKQAQKYKVTAVRNSLAEFYLKERGFELNKNLYLTSSFDKMWQTAFANQTDLVITNTAMFEAQLKAAGKKVSDAQFVLKLDDFSSDMFIAANLDTDKSLIHKVSNAYQKIKSDGRFEAIMAKWRLNTQ